MTLPAQFHSSLAQVERSIETVSAALLAGDSSALQAESAALQQAVVAFSGWAAPQAAAISQNKVLRERLLGVSRALGQQRDGMARRTVAVERTLAAVLPRDEAATYSGVAKPTFSSGAARIYANVAS